MVFRFGVWGLSGDQCGMGSGDRAGANLIYIVSVMSLSLHRLTNGWDSHSHKQAKLNMDACCLTSKEGLRLSQEQATLKAVQEQKKHETEEQ